MRGAVWPLAHAPGSVATVLVVPVTVIIGVHADAVLLVCGGWWKE